MTDPYAPDDVCPVTDLFRNQCHCDRCRPRTREESHGDGMPCTCRYHLGTGLAGYVRESDDKCPVHGQGER